MLRANLIGHALEDMSHLERLFGIVGHLHSVAALCLNGHQDLLALLARNPCRSHTHTCLDFGVTLRILWALKKGPLL